jgi:hypothetical protein
MTWYENLPLERYILHSKQERKIWTKNAIRKIYGLQIQHISLTFLSDDDTKDFDNDKFMKKRRNVIITIYEIYF